MSVQQRLWDRYVELVREDPRSREITELAVPLPAGPAALARVVVEVLGERVPFTETRSSVPDRIRAADDLGPDDDAVLMRVGTYRWLLAMAGRGSQRKACSGGFSNHVPEVLREGYPVGIVAPATADGPSIVGVLREPKRCEHGVILGRCYICI